MSREKLLHALGPALGTEIHASAWLTLTQARIDAFAAATGDDQWIHCDPARAERESPYGAPVAHGFLLLSLYAFLREHVGNDAPVYPGVRSIVNYGLNRVRFPNAVRVGARIRQRVELVELAEAGRAVQVVERVTIDVHGEEKPACVAELIRRFDFDG